MSKVGSLWMIPGAALVLHAAAPVPAPPSGLPFTRVWRAQDYQARSANFQVIQNAQGLIYVTNDQGLLEFDGAHWQLMPLPNDLQPRRLALGPEGQVVVAAYGWIGELRKDASGPRGLTSLMERIPTEHRTFTHVLGLFTQDQTLVAVTDRAIFLFGRETRVIPIPPDAPLMQAQLVQGVAWIQDTRFRLHTLEHDRLLLHPTWSSLPKDAITGMHPVGQQWLVTFRDTPPCLYDPRPEASLRILPPPPWLLDLRRRTTRNPILCLCPTPQGGWLVGTFGGGLLAYDAQGRAQWSLDEASGLGDNTVMGLFQDRDGHTWAALTQGLALVESGNALRLLNPHRGILGSGACILAPRTPGEPLLLGTYHGLYEHQPATDTFRALMDQTTQVFALARVSEGVLVGTDRGLFLLRQGRLSPISPHTTAELVALDEARTQFVGATPWGLHSIQKDARGTWISSPLQKMGDETLSLARTPEGDVWGVSSRRTLYRIRTQGGHLESFHMLDQAEGLQGNPIQVALHQGRLHVLTSEGILVWQGRRLEPATALNKALGNMVRQLAWMTSAPDGRLIVASPTACVILTHRPDDTWSADHETLARLVGMDVSACIEFLADGTLFLSRHDGFAMLHPGKPTRSHAFGTLLHRVSLEQDAPLWQRDLKLPRPLSIQAGPRALRFTFSAPSFAHSGPPSYRTWMEGFEPSWSAWSNHTLADFTNLPPGRYTFHVQGRTAAGPLPEASPFTFEVTPPWYRTWPVYLLALSAAGGLVHLAFRWRLSAHRQEQARLEGLVEEKTRELREISLRDPLTGVRNRRFMDLALRDSLQGFLLREAHHLRQAEGLRQPTDRVCGLLMLDMDHFKAVNDTYGHPAGDAVLQQLATRLTASIREGDDVIRMGGEEFLVVLKDTQESYVWILAERLRETLARTPFLLPDGTSLDRTCSIGCLVLPFDPHHPEAYTFDQHLQLVDLAVYRAKHLGRNRTVRLVPGEGTPLGQPLVQLLANYDLAQQAGLIQQRLKG